MSVLVSISIEHLAGRGWVAFLEDENGAYESEDPVTVLRRFADEIEHDQQGKLN